MFAMFKKINAKELVVGWYACVAPHARRHDSRHPITYQPVHLTVLTQLCLSAGARSL
jgi:hypothetical protein